MQSLNGAVPARPFIIWTLQRTGGTNLARRLFDASGLPGTDGKPLTTGTFLDRVTDTWKLHEPFNYGSEGRVFGFATEAWVARADRAQLDAVTEAVCAGGMPLKHCVEMVPAEVTASLLSASLRHGYRHIFLFRRNPLNRLLSMEFARRSGVWGPNLKGGSAPDDVVFAEPLPVDVLAEHERQCSARLTTAWQALMAAGAKPLPVAYEDIYQAQGTALVQARLAHLLHYLQIDTRKHGAGKFIEGIVGSGDQGTRDRYGDFAGIPALQEKLAALALFNQHDGGRRLRATTVAPLPDGVLHAALDNLPALFWPDMPVTAGGVILVSADAPEGWRPEITGQESLDAHWDIASPAMAQRFPAARNCAQSRFRFDNISLSGEHPLALRLSAENESVGLFQIIPGSNDA